MNINYRLLYIPNTLLVNFFLLHSKGIWSLTSLNLPLKKAAKILNKDHIMKYIITNNKFYGVYVIRAMILSVDRYCVSGIPCHFLNSVVEIDMAEDIKQSILHHGISCFSNYLEANSIILQQIQILEH